ncbi:MAG TPA: HD-GYP domain-containing protein [Solirubrobacteraceae bacterium]|jgi:putative nucleotidyltransferase with HDIG domain|nr:HD-GYP domain-containing protein [Solirubrobacteraceae bacterium]
MDLDSYETPGAETLLSARRDRGGDRGRARRLLSTEAVGAVLFLAGAVTLAVLAPWTRAFSPVALAVTAGAYLLAARATFPVGSAVTVPTQLVFVPMLFLLPTPLVPLVVAACLLADLWPRVLRRKLSVTLVLTRLGDSFYSLGPAVVLVLAGDQALSWQRWPVLVLAFAAQMLGDSGSGLARTWFAERIAPSQQVAMLWLYLTDACLSCVGLLVAAASVGRPGLVLLVLPLVALLWLFARERQQRIDSELALSTAYRGTALLLGDVVEADDHYTGTHSREVVDLALAVADALGLDPAQRRNVEFAALLHDVGKLHVPKSIINKPGALDDDEWAIIQRHTIDGEAMLKRVGGVLATVGQYVRSSHERYDGTGYPDGLIGDEIPIESRIVCVCDAYSAMTSGRAYRPTLAPWTAVDELRRCAGAQFDPRIVAAIEEHIARMSACNPARARRGFFRRPGTASAPPHDRPPALTV